MKFSVPTFSCRCLIREDIVTDAGTKPKGTLIVLPYGVAIQALAQGIVGAIEDADNTHVEALEAIARYGADAWFPAHLQTMAFLDEYLAVAEAKGFAAGRKLAEEPAEPYAEGNAPSTGTVQ